MRVSYASVLAMSYWKELSSDSIESVVEKVVASSKDESFDAFQFWCEWLDQAAKNNVQQDNLLKLAKSLKTRHVRDVNGKNLWADTPGLPMALRERFEVHVDLDKPREYSNINTFYARCAAEGVAETSMFGVILFRELLEEEGAHEDTELCVKGLQLWLNSAGAHLYNHGEPHLESNPLCRAGKKWTKSGGISKDRWMFWIAQLRDLGHEHAGASVAIDYLIKSMEEVMSSKIRGSA